MPLAAQTGPDEGAPTPEMIGSVVEWSIGPKAAGQVDGTTGTISEDLVAGTHGRSMFSLDLSGITAAGEAPAAASRLAGRIAASLFGLIFAGAGLFFMVDSVALDDVFAAAMHDVGPGRAAELQELGFRVRILQKPTG